MIAFVACLLVGWLLWFVFSDIPVYVTSEQARVEAAGSAHPVMSAASGRISAIYASPGKLVEKGGVLLKLESEIEARRLEEEKSRVAALRLQVDRLLREQESVRAAAQFAIVASEHSLHQARARLELTLSVLGLAEDREARGWRLYEGGLISDGELRLLQSKAVQARAEVEHSEIEIRRLLDVSRLDVTERQGRLERTENELSRLRGDLGAAEQRIGALEEELRWRSVSAPVSGRLTAFADLQVGQMIERGEGLGAVVPSGGFKVVARFSGADAWGHLQEGQPAEVRLDGFPWTQHGRIFGTVSRVASEADQSALRVEVILTGTEAEGIPWSHGLPGSVTVEVERSSPAALLTAAVGARRRVSNAQEEPGGGR